MRAVLQRAGEVQPSAKILKAADIVLDRDGRTVRVGEQFVDLTPSEFDILTALMTSPGRVYSRLDLLDIIQGVRYEGYERTIDTHIKNLRGKIESGSTPSLNMLKLYTVWAIVSKENNSHALHLLEINSCVSEHWDHQRGCHLCDRHTQYKVRVHQVPDRSNSIERSHSAF